MKILTAILIFTPLVALAQTSYEEQNKATTDCIPDRDANTGEISGYQCDQSRLHAVQAGKMDRLSLKEMKVMKLNQEPVRSDNRSPQVDSVEKAMELYNTLKDARETKLEIEEQAD